MDFVHDQMLDGRAFRILTVIDQWSRESVCLEANFRLSGRCVGQALDRLAAQREWPKAITLDNGTEFTSKTLDEGAYRRGVKHIC
jgi:putative transposase